MSAAITIAMPRMVPNQLLAEAHAKYPESLARALSLIHIWREVLHRQDRRRAGRYHADVRRTLSGRDHPGYGCLLYTSRAGCPAAR